MKVESPPLQITANQVTVLVAVAAIAFGYVSATLPPLDIGGDGHACMGDGNEACREQPFVISWTIHAAMIGIVLLPIVLRCGAQRGQTWSTMTTAIPPTILLLAVSVDAVAFDHEMSLLGGLLFPGIPLGLFATAILASLRSICLQLPPKERVPALVVAGYAYLAAVLTFIAFAAYASG